MNLDWSAQSPHIRTLFRPWQPGDGEDEATIVAGEARWGIRLPETLRSFYAAWGQRNDLTQMNEHLLAPDRLVVHAGMLIFCVENQACAYWALFLDSLEQTDPPVYLAEARPEMSVWEVASDLAWRASHQHVSAFLDDLTYLHAFSYGAVHGAESERLRPEPWQAEYLERNWRKAEVASLQMSDPDMWLGSPLYVREGQALHWFDRFGAVANSTEALDEIAQELGISWDERW